MKRPARKPPKRKPPAEYPPKLDVFLMSRLAEPGRAVVRIVWRQGGVLCEELHDFKIGQPYSVATSLPVRGFTFTVVSTTQ